MRTKVIMTICLFLLMAGKASAQWSVIDPTNIAQSIINSSNNIVHTSSTAQNMIRNFQETVKIYEQGKKYYDALKSVNNLVKDARKVQQTILMVGDITDIYINNYQKMMHDDNFSVEELSAIGFGYTKLLEESNDVLTELKNVVNITTLSMTDKERMDVVERCYSKMKRYRNLVSYYTNKNISVSYLQTVKIYEQGKKYYDALKSVNNLVKDARKVQQTILMVGDITDIYINNYQKMMHDDNFSVEELSAIGFGYTKLLEESNDVLTELKNVVNITTLSMTDKERMDVVERCYSKMKRYRNLVSYYTNKNISVSYLRAKKKNDLDRIMGLYGKSNEKYW